MFTLHISMFKWKSKYRASGPFMDGKLLAKHLKPQKHTIHI